MTAKYPTLYRSIQLIALLVILAGILAPGMLGKMEITVAIGLILLIGIPHGATDYLIFRHLTSPFLGTQRMSQFYLNYLFLMTAYALLWWIAPSLALALFMLLSMYHFGQSNWNYAGVNNKVLEYLSFLFWGSYVLLVPILWHYEESVAIIRQVILSEPPVITQAWARAISVALLIINIWIARYFWFQKKIGQREFVDEIVNLGVLGLLFISTPVLIGFAVYFVFWHSLSSIMDQVRFFRQQFRSQYNWQQYVKHTLPFTLLAIAGLAIMVWGQQQLGIGVNVGILFIFISVVTLPHMILIDRLYEELDENL